MYAIARAVAKIDAIIAPPTRLPKSAPGIVIATRIEADVAVTPATTTPSHDRAACARQHEWQSGMISNLPQPRMMAMGRYVEVVGLRHWQQTCGRPTRSRQKTTVPSSTL